MKGFFLNKFLNPVGGRGGVNWSSYWATREPSGLVLTATTDTQIDGLFTINGTGQDGHKVYISDDGVTYTLAETLTGSDNTFSIAELTSGTKKYIKVVAYKGTQESTGVSDYAVTAIESILSDANAFAQYNIENTASLRFATGSDVLVERVKDVLDVTDTTLWLHNLNHGLTPTLTENDGLLFDGSTALNGNDLAYTSPADMYIIIRQNEWTVNKRPFELNHDSGVLIHNYLNYDAYKCLATYFGGVSGPRTNLMTSQWVLLKISINGTSIKIQINDRNLEEGSCGLDANWRQIAFGGSFTGEPFNKINLLRAIFRGGDDAATAKKISDRLQYEYRDKLAITPDTHENAAVCILGDSLSWYLGHYHLMDEYSTSYLAEGGVGTLLQKFMWDQQTYSLQASFQYIFCMMSVNDQNLTVEQYTTIYQAFINQLRLEAPNAIIIGVELTPVKGCLTHFAGDDGYAKYLTFNEAIRGEGANALTGFDHILTSHNDILDDGTGALKPEYDGGDHLHLTEAGYTVIANKYKEFIV